MGTARPAAPPAHRCLQGEAAPAVPAAAAAAPGTLAAAVAAQPCRGPAPEGLAGVAAPLQTQCAGKARALNPDFHQWGAREGGAQARALEEAPPTPSCPSGRSPGARSRDGEGPSVPSGAPAAPERRRTGPALEPAPAEPLPSSRSSRALPQLPGNPSAPRSAVTCRTEQGAVTAGQRHWRWGATSPRC